MSVKRAVIGALVVGFVVPTFWVFGSIALMGAKGWWTNAYRMLVRITCPFGLTDSGGLGNAIARSVLNAALYGVVVGALAGFWKQLHADFRRPD